MKDIYTPLEAAFDVIEERRQDERTRDRVAEYLGDRLPDVCLEAEVPTAVLARYVARATGEDSLFANLALEAGFSPAWATYFTDQYTTRNPEKVATVRPPLLWAKGQKTRQWIVAPQDRQGEIGNLPTIYGSTAADFQRTLREVVLPRQGLEAVLPNEFDMSEWYKFQTNRLSGEEGAKASVYYLASMALFTTFAVLFEDFEGGPNAGGGDLASFKAGVVTPAIQQVKRDLGLEPVIVRLPFTEGMGNTDLSFLPKQDAEELRVSGKIDCLFDRVKGWQE